MQAVTPEPQLVTTGREPSTPACASRARTASAGAKRAVGVQQIGVGQAGRARDVAAAHAGARLGHLAGEAAGGAGIQHQFRLRRRRCQHVADAAQPRGAIVGTDRRRAAAAAGRRLRRRGPRAAISAGRRPAPRRCRGRTAPSATSRAPPRPGPSGRRTPPARRWTRRAAPSAWRTGRGSGPCAAGRCPDRPPRRCRSSARRECGRGRNSARPSLSSFGRYLVASNTTRSGLPSSRGKPLGRHQRSHRFPFCRCARCSVGTGRRESISNSRLVSVRLPISLQAVANIGATAP